ncbi:MAG: phage replisome organizer N-terminal domain-containing protein [Clostridiales bacterium]|nr:phage replisome organizer N-terminal domain-containing protein [Clostridiales bacterium]
MADNKKYYYLKLKENFFESDSMLLLESLPDGYLYSNVLLKLYLKSLKYGGRLALNGRIPYNTEMLAMVTRHSVETVEKAIEVFKEFGLVEILDSGIIYMTDIQNFIGNSSSEADRIRKYRKQIKAEKDGVQMYGQMYDKCTPETETETEKKKETENRDKKNSASVSALFSFEELQEIVRKNKVKLSNEGVRTFYYEMAKSGWILYGKPVTRDGIVKSIRGWVKYHKELQKAEDRKTERNPSDDLALGFNWDDVQDNTDPLDESEITDDMWMDSEELYEKMTGKKLE